MLVFTVCHPSQLSNAHVLGDSLMQSNPNAEFIIGVCGNVKIDSQYKIIELPNVVSNFIDLTLKFDKSELLAACKTYFFKYLSENSPTTKLLYFDCNSVILQSLETITTELETNNILLIPQILHSSIHPEEKRILNAGIFHSGFLAINNLEEAKKFVAWWSKNTLEKGYRNLCKGMNQDQLWLELVPTLFDGVKILKLDGLNIGSWNATERVINPITKIDTNRVISYNFTGQKYPKQFVKLLLSYKKLNSPNQFGLPIPQDKTIKKKIARPFRFIAEQIDVFFDRF